jgi:nucleoside-diphosphate-sugar epimerase
VTDPSRSKSAGPSPIVAVTGATGFIGGHVARALDAAGWRVRALVRRAGRGPGFATRIVGTLEDRQSLERLVEGVDAVVHCAGLLRAASAAEFHAVNEAGVGRLAAAAAAAAANRRSPPRFILMSSLAAREPALSSYGSSKRDGEQALARHGDGLAWTALRPPAVYGPGDRATLDFFRLYSHGLALLPGGADGRLSLIHGEDLAAAVVALLASEAGAGEIFEIRDGHAGGYGWADLAAAAGHGFGRPGNRPMIRLVLPRALMDGLAMINQGFCRMVGGAPRLSRDKVRELYHPDWVVRENPIAGLTGWRPRMTLEQGFAQTIAWYRAEGWL